MTKQNFPAYKPASVSALIPYARNARTHSDAQIDKIAASIQEFGFLNPVIVDGENGIIAGHGRVMAAKKLGMTEVPTVEADHLTDTQRRAYILADNRLALDAGWGEDLLAGEIGSLQDEGFDIGLTGFADDEVDKLTDDDDGLAVHQIDTATVSDRFWISVRGPLVSQADALLRLQQLMDHLDGVEVQLGTISDD